MVMYIVFECLFDCSCVCIKNVSSLRDVGFGFDFVCLVRDVMMGKYILFVCVVVDGIVGVSKVLEMVRL